MRYDFLNHDRNRVVALLYNTCNIHAHCIVHDTSKRVYIGLAIPRVFDVAIIISTNNRARACVCVIWVGT